jgi:hypothetical protein
MSRNTTVHAERQYPRHAVQTGCIVVSEDGQRLLGERALDLSWDGVRVECAPGTPDAVRVGERVRVRVQIPRSEVWIDAGGWVARVAPGRRRGDDPPALGVSLNRMDGMMRILLASTIRHRPVMKGRARGPRRDYAAVVRRIAARA